MEFKYFKENNKSGYKTREDWFSKNHPKEYEQIINYCSKIPLILSFKEKIWFFFNKLIKRPNCVSCGCELKFRERFDDVYGDFCSQHCINTNKIEMNNRIKKTFQKKYGIDYYPNHPDFANKMRSTKKELYGSDNYVNLEKIRATKKELYGNEYYNNIEKQKTTIFERYGAKNFSNTKEFDNIVNNTYKNIYSKINIVAVNKRNVTIFCDKCNSEVQMRKQVMENRFKLKNIICTTCNALGNSFRSNGEKKVCSFLDELNIKYKTSFTIPKKKTQVDILIPSHNLGIEFNGLYWHSDVHRNNNYHLNKTKDCLNNNINLFHIFEDEWVYKSEIIKSIIKQKLGLIKIKIKTELCEIRQVSQPDYFKFLNENHIEGQYASLIAYGLYHKNDLVSIVTATIDKLNNLIIDRFCDKINTNIVGATDKLINYIVNEKEIKKVIAESDIRFCNDDIYERLGFNKSATISPRFYYINQTRRYNKSNFIKSKLVKEGADSSKSLKEIMKNKHFHRIYDCGHIKWSKIF